MALEISEVGIRIRVRGDVDGEVFDDTPEEHGSGASGDDQQLIDRCVRRVLQILKAAQER